MASYYQHKSTQSRKIPYSFQCEHCLQDSGPLTATITGSEATCNSHHKTLKDGEQHKLQQDAHKALEAEIRRVHSKAQDKQHYSSAFGGECPHCGKPQSWSIAGLQSDAASTPKILLLVAVIVAAGTYFTQGKNLILALILGGVFAAAAALLFLYKTLAVGAKKRASSAGLQQNLPTIDWTAARDLLEDQ